MRNYESIVAECRSAHKLYEDPDFEAVNSNLFYSRDPPRPFEWKRPKEIVSNPKFIVDGASRFDIVQGTLCDGWLLSAISSLSVHKAHLNKVIIPNENEPFDSRNYCGAIRFNIWQDGEWTEVVIDDRLPTYNGRLVFMRSAEKEEFWSPLLEKAFAKLAGSYEGLKGGQTGEGMCNLSGGIIEIFDLMDRTPDGLFKMMLKANQRGSLMGCSINAESNEVEAKGDLGLIKGHAYSVTGVKKVELRTRSGERQEEMVRVRNPWGNEREWTGPWGDGSREWQMVPDTEKREIGLTFEDDGEFWMAYRDFIKYFNRLEMCNLSAESGADEESSKIGYHTFQEKGIWVRGSTAGGCRNFIKSFASNPQYRVTLEDADDDDDDLCTLVVSVIQTGRRELKDRGIEFLTIGFTIYKIEEEKDTQASVLGKEFFMCNASSARSPRFINSYEVTGRFKLPPGEYVVIPSTFEPNHRGDFLIRIFSEKPQPSRRADEKTKFERQQHNVARPEDKDLNDKFYQFFETLAGPDMHIDAAELKQILSSAFKEDMEGGEISLECCKSMISFYGKDSTELKLSYNDFKTVWVELRTLRNTFHAYDHDKSNCLSTYELREVFKKIGFQLSNSVLYTIQARFQIANTVNFEHFLMAIIRLKALDERLALKSKGYQTMDFEDIIMAVMTL